MVLASVLCRLALPFAEVELQMLVPTRAHKLQTVLQAGCLHHMLLGPRRLRRSHCPHLAPMLNCLQSRLHQIHMNLGHKVTSMGCVCFSDQKSKSGGRTTEK